MNMLSSFDLPPILLDVPRNAVLAIGLPLVLGSLSGYPTSKVVNGPWYKVCEGMEGLSSVVSDTVAEFEETGCRATESRLWDCLVGLHLLFE